jgi:hypothetical protein
MSDDEDYMNNLVKDENVIEKPINIQYRPLPAYSKQPIRQEIPPIHPPKNKISYDEILESMNMRVVNGKLEMIIPTQKEAGEIKKVYPQQNSYIHNKYFKNSANQQERPLRPLTHEEYRALMIKRQIEIQRINLIKPKKLLFSTNHINISHVYREHNLNRLFRFVGKK